MTTDKQNNAREVYSSLMQEIKVRTHFIERCLRGDYQFPERISEEFCYLQLRLICELIAMSSLVAHGDIKETENLKGQYRADWIMKKLSEIHPNFYPTAYTRETKEPARHHITRIKDGFLSKDELVTLYRISGNFAHRGTIKRLLNPKNAQEPNLEKIIEYLKKIFTLLNTHEIALIDPTTFIMCIMHGWNQMVQTAWVNAVPQDEPSQSSADHLQT